MCLICEVKNTKLKSSVTTTYKIRSGATVRRTKPAWIQDEITRPTQLKCSDVTSLFDCLRYCPNNVTVHYRNSPPQKKHYFLQLNTSTLYYLNLILLNRFPENPCLVSTNFILLYPEVYPISIKGPY